MDRRSSYHSCQYGNPFPLPQPPRASTIRSSTILTTEYLPLLSLSTQTYDQKVAWKLRSSSLVPKSGMQEIATVSTNSRISTITKLISSSETESTSTLSAHAQRSDRNSRQKHNVGQNSSEPGKNKTISMPNLKEQVRNYSWIHSVPPPAKIIPSTAIRNSTIALTSDLDSNELHFPLPPVHDSHVNEISTDLVSHNQPNDFQQLNMRCQGEGQGPDEKNFNPKPYPYLKAKSNVDFYQKKPKRYETRCDKLAAIPLASGKSSSHPQYHTSHNSRSHPYKLKNSNTSTSATPLINFRNGNGQVPSRVLTTVSKVEELLGEGQRAPTSPCTSDRKQSKSLTSENYLMRTKTDCVVDVTCKNESPRIRLGLRLMTDKRELIKACRVVGSETRLLTLRRHSLTGIKVKWVVVDNGLAVRGNMDCGKLVLRCFGESDGKVDFFTAEDISIFRFQRTVGSTRTATSIDGDNENVYFSVRDGSWDCSARWEVSVSITKDQCIEKWLVTGDKFMRGLEIRRGDRVLGIVRDHGEHEYILQVFPNNNWCIVTALAILFDEWKASHVGLLL